MSLLFQLARSVGRCTMLSCRYLSFKFGPRCDFSEVRSIHYRQGKSSPQSTKQQAQAEKQEKKEEAPYEDKEKQLSMWQHHARMYRKCPDVTPRMDDLYYTASDIDTRVYKQTWIDYPDVKVTKKVKYDFAELDALSDPLLVKAPLSESSPPQAAAAAANTSDNVKSKKSYMNSLKD